MPFRAKAPCKKFGCPNLVSAPGFCDIHKKDDPRRKSHGNTTERGYGWLWQSKIRPRILRRDPFCMSGVICDADNVGRRAVSTYVDHIVPKEEGGTDAEENLQGLCHECHSWKTAKQDSNFIMKKANQQ
jgi:5-methylcytosine-specific restriction protein A